MNHGREIYTVDALLIFSWSDDTCWGCWIWRADSFWFH